MLRHLKQGYNSKIEVSFKEISTKRIVTLQWDSRLLLFLMFLVFGLYGWGTSTVNFNVLQNTLFLCVILACIVLAYHGNSVSKTWAKKKFDFLVMHLLQIIFLWTLIVFTNLSWLTKSLSIDELAYSWLSNSHAYVILTRYSVFLPEALQTQSAANFLHLLSILVVGSLFVLVQLIRRIKRTWILITLVLVLVSLFRMGVLLQGASSAVNTPMPLAWLLFSSTFFGINDAGFRLGITFLMSLGLFVILHCWRGEKWYRHPEAFLFVVIFLGIVGTHRVGVMVEIASFGFIFNLVVLFLLANNNYSVQPWMFLFLAIIFYFRVPSVFLFLPLIFLRYLETRELKRIYHEMFVPGVVLLPGVLSVAVNRAIPSLFSNDTSGNSFEQSARNTLQVLLDTGMLFYLLGPLILQVILHRRISMNKKFLAFIASYTASFIFVFIMLIPTQLSVGVKYTHEYFLPLVLLLVFMAFKEIRTKVFPNAKQVLRTSFQIMPIIVSLILLFVFQYSRLAYNQRELFKVANDTTIAAQKVFTVTPFDYQESYRFIEELRIKECINAGPTYSSFVDVLGGVSLGELLNARALRENFIIQQSLLAENWLTVSIESLEASGARCAIVGPLANRKELMQDLVESEWRVAWSSVDSMLGTETSVILRN